MKNVILGVSIALLVCVAVFAFAQHNEARKQETLLTALTQELEKTTLRVEQLKQNAEMQAAQAVTAVAEAERIKQKLDNCVNK